MVETTLEMVEYAAQDAFWTMSVAYAILLRMTTPFDYPILIGDIGIFGVQNPTFAAAAPDVLAIPADNSERDPHGFPHTRT